MRAKNHPKMIDDLPNLTAAQKAELKLVHSQVCGKEAQVFLSYHVKVEPKIAAYNYQFFRVKKYLPNA